MNRFEDFPALPLDVRPVPPNAWHDIVQRARRRRDRAAAATTAVVAVIAAVPSFALMDRGDSSGVPAHQPAREYSDVCDTAYDKQAPATDAFDHVIRVGAFVISPPGANKPAVSAAEIRRRAQARGMKLQPGTQVRYGLVRYVSGIRVVKAQARWVMTTCGRPQPRYLPSTARDAKPSGTMLADDVHLVSDSGATTDGLGHASFGGVCDTRLDAKAPAGTQILMPFHVGEGSVDPPSPGDQLGGRDRVRAALRDAFPGTQIRLGRVRPLHTPGASRLRWLVTTCGLDGSSVRPELPGAVNELLVYNAQGRLLDEHRSGARSEAEAIIPRLPPVPFPAPTYRSAGPNICGPWSHAYPDFREKATAAGYTDMQGCYLQSEAVIIFVSKPGGRAAAAVYRAASPKEYDATYKARFPYARFTFVPAPVGDTIKLVKLLSPHVAEVELSGAGVAAVHWKFDAETTKFLPCTDTTATRAPCS